MHRLASLVAFCDFGDDVQIAEGGKAKLSVSGPAARNVPLDGSNLAVRAAGLIAGGRSVQISLYKRIPAAAGLGGGSANAAAVLKLLARHKGVPVPSTQMQMELGADVPVCLAGVTALVEEAGEKITPIAYVPPLDLVLVNPGVEVSTRAVFERFSNPREAVLEAPPDECSRAGFLEWLALQRNDLQAASIQLRPEIREVLDQLEQLGGCQLARMTGSGATCFGVFSGAAEARSAARWIRSERPSWWVAVTCCGFRPDEGSTVPVDGE